MGTAVSIKGYTVGRVMELYGKLKEAGAGDWHGEDNFRSSLANRGNYIEYHGFTIPYLAIDEVGDIVGYTHLDNKDILLETEEELIKFVKERK